MIISWPFGFCKWCWWTKIDWLYKMHWQKDANRHNHKIFSTTEYINANQTKKNEQHCTSKRITFYEWLTNGNQITNEAWPISNLNQKSLLSIFFLNLIYCYISRTLYQFNGKRASFFFLRSFVNVCEIIKSFYCVMGEKDRKICWYDIIS